jgi:predicted AlkP superfamily pyrophosphatase or phosphodiesterase
MKASHLILMFVLLLSGVGAVAQDTAQIVASGRVNSREQINKSYVILISADGFRHDFAEKYQAKTLLGLSKKGIRAAYLQASYPTLTFPNHYTIATGMYPAHHGLVDNNIYDPGTGKGYSIGNKKAVRDSSWYGGIPLWVLAEQQHMLAASFYWVGSEAAVLGVRPTYYYNYSEKIGIDSRIATVKKWLELPEAERPHLITFYLPEVDHAAHKFGPDSKQTQEEVTFVDESIRKMTEALANLKLDINYIFVADHGMTAVDTKNTLSLPAAVDTSKFKVVPGSALVHLYARNPADIFATYEGIKAEAKDYDVYLATNMPAQWHYSKTDDTYNRIGDILLVPHLPRVFNLGKYNTQIGHHGFDPLLPDMRATFYAWGPAFKRKKSIPGFENVHIYPLIAEILGLNHSHTIDGNLEVLKGVLR